MLNEMKFFRQKKQDRRDMLKHEFDVAEHQEQREQVKKYFMCISVLLFFRDGFLKYNAKNVLTLKDPLW